MAASSASRSRLRWASSRVVRSDISTPARPASERMAVAKSTPSRSMTKLKMSPPRPQPKHFHVSREGVTVKDGVFSPWNGQRPLKVVPAFLSWTVSPMRSTMSSFSLMVAATPTDKPAGPFMQIPTATAEGRDPWAADERDGIAPAVQWWGWVRRPLPAETRVALSSLDKALRGESSHLTTS